jgi:hypothetical protein
VSNRVYQLRAKYKSRLCVYKEYEIQLGQGMLNYFISLAHTESNYCNLVYQLSSRDSDL